MRHGLKVGPSSRHTLVSQTIKFSCQALRHSCNTEHFVDDDDHHHHHHHHHQNFNLDTIIASLRSELAIDHIDYIVYMIYELANYNFL